jgi:hypothetical protein
MATINGNGNGNGVFDDDSNETYERSVLVPLRRQLSDVWMYSSSQRPSSLSANTGTCDTVNNKPCENCKENDCKLLIDESIQKSVATNIVNYTYPCTAPATTKHDDNNESLYLDSCESHSELSTFDESRQKSNYDKKTPPNVPEKGESKKKLKSW